MNRGFEHFNCAIAFTYPERWDLLILLFAPYLFFLGNVTKFPAALQPSSTCQWFRLLTVCGQCFTHQPIVFCIVRPTHNSLGLAMRAVSLFSSWVAALISRPLNTHTGVRALPLLNLKKKRDYSQSTTYNNKSTGCFEKICDRSVETIGMWPILLLGYQGGAEINKGGTLKAMSMTAILRLITQRFSSSLNHIPFPYLTNQNLVVISWNCSRY